MSEGSYWKGAIDTDEGRAFHRTVGEHRAWVAYYSGWCYPTNLCEWCHEQRGDEQVWLPAEGTPGYEALVERLEEVIEMEVSPKDAARDVLAALREEA